MKAFFRSRAWWGALASGMVYLYVFGPGFAIGDHPFWKECQGDGIAAMAGANYYLKDAWRFPLFFTKNFNYPEGQNILFTGAIPPVALLGKIFYSLTGIPANYFVAWYDFCYLAQGFIAASILMLFGVRSRLYLFCAGFFVAFLPAFIDVYGWTCYVAHFVILLTFYFYFYSLQSRKLSTLYLFAAYMALASTVDIYIFTMSYPFFIASLFDNYRRKWLSFWRAVGVLVFSLAMIRLLFFIGGFIDPNRMPAPPVGFGDNSTNVASLFWGVTFVYIFSNLFPHWQNAMAAPRHYHGYVYVGIGVLLMWAIALVVRLRSKEPGTPIRRALWQHLGLVLATIATYGFSLSDHVYLWEHRVMRYDIPAFLQYFVYQFRASGRFGWPAMYLTVIASLIVYFRALPRKKYYFLLILPLALTQLWELRLKIQESRRGAAVHTTYKDPDKIKHDMEIGFFQSVWREALPHYQRVAPIPSLQCGPVWDYPGKLEFHVLVLMESARAGVVSNDSYVGRFVRDCPLQRILDFPEKLEDGVLYFGDRRFVNWVHFGLLEPLSRCRESFQGFFCAKDLTPVLDAEARVPEFLKKWNYPYPFPSPSKPVKGTELSLLPLNQTLALRDFPNVYAFFFGAWSQIQEPGLALIGKKGFFGFQSEPGKQPRAIQFAITALALRPAGVHLNVVNERTGKTLTRWSIAEDSAELYTVPIAASDWDREKNLFLRFEVEEFPAEPRVFKNHRSLDRITEDRIVVQSVKLVGH